MLHITPGALMMDGDILLTFFTVKLVLEGDNVLVKRIGVPSNCNQRAGGMFGSSVG